MRTVPRIWDMRYHSLQAGEPISQDKFTSKTWPFIDAELGNPSFFLVLKYATANSRWSSTSSGTTCVIRGKLAQKWDAKCYSTKMGPQPPISYYIHLNFYKQHGVDISEVNVFYQNLVNLKFRGLCLYQPIGCLVVDEPLEISPNDNPFNIFNKKYCWSKKSCTTRDV